MEEVELSTHPNFKNLLAEPNTKFSMLTIIGYVGKRKGKHYWKCLCDCGKITYSNTSSISNRYVKSCGCLKETKRKELFNKHNLCGTRLYEVWKGIKKRCYNKNCKQYKNYGGRGIKMCDSWRESASKFIEDMGPLPDDKVRFSVERKDNNGDYCKENCKWGTDLEQANNTRQNRFIEYNGEKLSLSQWGRKLGISPNRIRGRLNRGWTEEQALTVPKNISLEQLAKSIEYKGEHFLFKDLAKKFNLNPGTLRARLNRGWSLEDSLTKPLDHRKPLTKKSK